MLKWMQRNQNKLVVSLALLLMITVFVLCCCSIKTTPEIVYFDLKVTQQGFSAQLSKRTEIAEVEKERIARRFGQSIEVITQAYAKKHNAIVLVKPAVIAGAKDITAQLQSEILAWMQQDG